jgi:hypothetical protein
LPLALLLAILQVSQSISIQAASTPSPGGPEDARQSQWVKRSSSRSFMTSAATSGQSLLYVSERSKGTVEIFPETGSHQRPVGAITGLLNPSGLAVDGEHNLWVNNQATPTTILAFHRGALQPFISLSAKPGWGIVVDHSGTVYAADFASNVIDIYRKGATSPTSRLMAAKMTFMFDLALNSKGDLFCSGAWSVNSSETVYPIIEFPAGSKRSIRLQSDVGALGGLAISQKQELVSEAGGALTTYAPPYTGAPTGTVSVKGAQTSIATGANGSSIWVLQQPLKTLFAARYAVPRGNRVARTNGGGLNDVQGIAVDPGGE